MENEIQPTQVTTPKILLIILLEIIVITASVFVGIQIGKNQLPNQQQLVPTPLVKDTTPEWVTYQVPQLDLSFKMPQELNPSQSLNFTTSYSNLYWNDSPEKPIKLIATSVNSTFEGGFSYLTGCVGYEKDETGYKFLTYTNAKIEMSSEFTKEVTNQNQVRYLIVKSDPNLDSEGMPPPGVVEKGFIAAIINTNNTEYPALVVQMRLTDINTESVFNQILSTFKVSN